MQRNAAIKLITSSQQFHVHLHRTGCATAIDSNTLKTRFLHIISHQDIFRKAFYITELSLKYLALQTSALNAKS